MRKAVVLLSGGLDSSTVLAIAKAEGFEVHALTFDYNQRHRVEIEAARNQAASQGVAAHSVVRVDFSEIGGSLLVPGGRHSAPDSPGAIPATYVPARNAIFLAYAVALAEVVGAEAVFVGVNAVDYSGYPDCRSEFVAAFETMANLATRAGVEGRRVAIRAPLLSMSKTEIVRKAEELGVNVEATHSCYFPEPDGKACGRCDSCRIRNTAMAET